MLRYILVFSPDNSLLAVVTYDGGVQLWNVVDGQRGLLLDADDYDSSYKSITFSPDGKYLASGTNEDNKVWLWSVADGQLLRMMQTNQHAERVNGLAFSPDGQVLVGGDFSSGNKVNQTHVWDVETGQLIRSFDKKTWLPTFSADGKLLASTFIEEYRQAGFLQPTDPICLWDVESRCLLFQFKGHKERIQRLVFSPSGHILISCGNDGVASWWDIESGQEVYRLEASSSTRASGAYSTDRKHLASGSKNGTLHLWLIKEGKLERTIERFPGGWGLEGAAINSDGTHIASWTQGSFVSGALCIWIKDDSRPLQLGKQEWVFSAAFSPNNELVAAGCDDHKVHIWNIKEDKLDRNIMKKPVHTFKQHSDDVRCLTFSLDDRPLASGSRDCAICLWDIEKKGAPLHIFQGHVQEVMTLAFSPDSKLLASGSEDQTIRIWDVFSGQLLHIVEGHTGTVSCFAFSPDGKHIASGSTDGSIRVWNVANGTSQSVQHDITQTVTERAFTLDGKPITSNNIQESVWLWEIPPHRCRYTISNSHICKLRV